MKDVQPQTLLDFWQNNQYDYLTDAASSTRTGHVTVLKRLLKHGWEDWDQSLSESSRRTYESYLNRVLSSYQTHASESENDESESENDEDVDRVYVYGMTWTRKRSGIWVGHASRRSGVSGTFWSNWRSNKRGLKAAGYQVRFTGTDEERRKMYRATYSGTDVPTEVAKESDTKAEKNATSNFTTVTKVSSRSRIQLDNGFELVLPKVLTKDDLSFIDRVSNLVVWE